MEKVRDIFICHASEDKDEIARPLAEALRQAEISCWYDEAEIRWGDSITQKVNEGLAKSKYVVVIFSASFIGKNWPERELFAVLNQEATSGQIKVLPLLVGSMQEQRDILSRYPLLNDKRYLPWDGDLRAIVKAVHMRLRGNADKAENPASPSSIGLRIPLPKIKKQFSQRERDIFVRAAFSTARTYFETGLKELESHYEEIQTDFVEVHKFKFVCTIYVRGETANRCKVWLGGISSTDAIAFQAGQFNIDSDNSYNEILSITDDGESLRFKSIMNLMTPKDKLSPEEGAQYLWQRFTERLG